MINLRNTADAKGCLQQSDNSSSGYNFNYVPYVDLRANHMVHVYT